MSGMQLAVLDADHVQRWTRDSLRLKDKDVDALNLRLISCMARGMLNIPVLRLWHATGDDEWYIVMKRHTFEQQFASVERRDMRLLEDREFSLLISQNQAVSRRTMAILAYLHERKIIWSTRHACLYVTPRVNGGGAGGSPRSLASPNTGKTRWTGAWQERLHDVIVCDEYVVTADMGLSNLADIGWRTRAQETATAVNAVATPLLSSTPLSTCSRCATTESLTSPRGGAVARRKASSAVVSPRGETRSEDIRTAGEVQAIASKQAAERRSASTGAVTDSPSFIPVLSKRREEDSASTSSKTGKK